MTLTDFVDPSCGFSRWYITPYLVKEGETLLVPESVSHPEDTLNINHTYPTREGYAPWVFLPCLSSHYYLGRGWHAASQWEDLIEEEVADVITSDFKELSEDLQKYGEEEFEDNYDQEALSFMKTLKDWFPDLTDIGWNFSYEVSCGYLYINLWLGDCSVEPTHKGKPEHSGFSAEELQDLETGDLEDLDMGVLPYDWEAEDLAPRVLAYSLGYYLRKQLGKEVMGEDLYYHQNLTLGLYTFLLKKAQVEQLENLSWGSLEGPEVAKKWVQVVTDLSQQQ